MQNLHLYELSAEASRCHVHHYQLMLRGLPGPPSIEHSAHGTKKPLLKTHKWILASELI